MLDFPNAPTLNQPFQNYFWDGEKWMPYALPLTPPQGVSTQRGFIYGLTVSIVAQPAVTTSPGLAADSTNTTMLNLLAAITKTTAAWAPGNNNGGLDTGAMNPGTWYHWFLIYNPTTQATDIVFSATATPDAGPSVMPAGYTLFRRIFSLRWTATNIWFAVSQRGDQFLYAVTNQDINAAALNAGSRLFYTLLTPPGVICDALIRVTVAAAASCLMLITSPSENDQAVSGTSTGVTARTTAASDGGSTTLSVRTDNQSRIGARSSIAGTWYCSTYGYIDRRGKDG